MTMHGATCKRADHLAAIERRVEQAERGEWTQLLRDYVTDMLCEQIGAAQATVVEAAQCAAKAASDRIRRASAKLDGASLRAACNILEGDGKAPPTDMTCAEVDRLVATQVNEEERTATQQWCKHVACEAERSKIPPPKTRTIKWVVRQLNQTAEAGPSAWNNRTL